jgi:hypothetical protein
VNIQNQNQSPNEPPTRIVARLATANPSGPRMIRAAMSVRLRRSTCSPRRISGADRVASNAVRTVELILTVGDASVSGRGYDALLSMNVPPPFTGHGNPQLTSVDSK